MTDAPDPFPYPLPVVIEALSASGGVLLLAATKLGCERATIERDGESHPSVALALEEIRASNADIAEAGLIKAVGAGASWAIQKQLGRAAPAEVSRVRGRDGRFPPNYRPTIQPWGERVPALRIPADATPAEEAAIRRERAHAMEEIILEVATDPTNRPETRAAAAAKLQEIDAPKVTRNINLNLTAEDVADLADHDLDLELARLEREAARAPEGEAPASLPGALPDLRH